MEWLIPFAPLGLVVIGCLISYLFGWRPEDQNPHETEARKWIWRHIGGHGDRP